MSPSTASRIGMVSDPTDRSIVSLGFLTKGRDTATVELEIDDRVATVWLNRPHRLNAVTPELVDDLISVLGRVSLDPTVDAVVLAGRGRAFCSGHDLKQPPPQQEPFFRSRWIFRTAHTA